MIPKIILIVAIALAIFFGYTQLTKQSSKSYIDASTVIAGDYKVDKGKTVVLKNGSKLTVEGKANIDGRLECEGGPIDLETKGDLVVNGVILCNKHYSEVRPGMAEIGINLILGGSADFEKDSVIATNSHLQIVESKDLLLKTQKDFKKAFNEVAMDSGEGIRIGPLFAELPKQTLSNESTVLGEATKSADASKDKKVRMRGKVKIGQSVGHPDAPFPKSLDLEKVPKDLDYILVWFKLPNREVQIEDAYMFTPDGHDGESITKGCDINVPQTEDPEDQFKRHAMRMRMHARVIKINNYNLYLGDGGKGGDAITDKDCDPEGKAVAGMGGNPANFKWTADEAIEILGGFYIYPGKGGNGGKAVAYGKDGAEGCPGENGRNAKATGGNGAANPRTLSAKGDVRGLNNIYIGSMIGGKGGDAEVNPGKGGSGTDCDCKGGLGGNGFGTFGKGGSVSLSYPKGVQRMVGAEDKKGEDGKGMDALGIRGEDGSICSDKTVKSTPKPTPALKIDGGSTSDDYSDGYFEFLDIATGQPSIAFSTAQKPHIIVAADSGVDVRNWLPIRIEIKKDGSNFWSGKIDGDPSQVCRGPSGCSTNGPSGIGLDWKKIEIIAYDKNNRVVATFGETYNPR